MTTKEMLTWPETFGISPSMQERKLDLPAPTAPHTATRIPL